MWVISFLLAVVLLCTVASANVIGIDFGSDYMKVAGPHSGNAVDIVLNEQSHRKTDAYIGFRNGERHIGDQARALAVRFPLNMVTMVNELVGITYDSPHFEEFKQMQCEFETRREERNTIGFSFGQENGAYTSEELYAMMLQYCQSISKKDGVADPRSVAVTISFRSPFGKRQAILEAARLVDMKVLGLIHRTTAAALYYGIRRRGFENRTINLLIYDIGSAHTEVGVYRFSPTVGQAGKKVPAADSFGTLTTLAVVDGGLLGGRAFDICISRVIEAEAMTKMKIPHVIGGTTLPQRKSRFSLLRAAKKARETLSANTQTPLTVESIVPERDFHTEISRQKFEQECSDLFERIPKVAEEAINQAGLTLKDIDAFEMMGGASRTPKIIASLSALLGREVDRTLNSDEAAAIGAAYYALRLAPQYRIRSFRVVEHIPFVFYFTILPTPSNSSGSRRKIAEKPIIGSRRSITVNRTDDFTIQIFDSHDAVGEIAVTGVNAALEQLGFFAPTIEHSNNSHIVRIQLRLNDSGLFEVEEALVIYRYATNASTRAKSANSSEESSNAHVMEDTIKMKVKSTPITAQVKFTTPPPLSEKEFLLSKDKIHMLLEAERKKHEAALAKNDLETYVLWAKRDGVLENVTALSLYTSEDIEQLKAMLSDVLQWLEDGEGSYETCTKEEYITKLEELQKLVRQETRDHTETDVPPNTDSVDVGDL